MIINPELRHGQHQRVLSVLFSLENGSDLYGGRRGVSQNDWRTNVNKRTHTHGRRQCVRTDNEVPLCAHSRTQSATPKNAKLSHGICVRLIIYHAYDIWERVAMGGHYATRLRLRQCLRLNIARILNSSDMEGGGGEVLVCVRSLIFQCSATNIS